MLKIVSKAVVGEGGLRTSIFLREEEWSCGSMHLASRVEHHFVDCLPRGGHTACDIIRRAINKGVASRGLVFPQRFPELGNKWGTGLVPKPRLPPEEGRIEVCRWI